MEQWKDIEIQRWRKKNSVNTWTVAKLWIIFCDLSLNQTCWLLFMYIMDPFIVWAILYVFSVIELIKFWSENVSKKQQKKKREKEQGEENY